MKRISNQLVCLVFLLALTTCSDTGIKPVNLNSNDKLIPTNDAAIKFNGDFLEFASPKDFDEALASLTNASPGSVLKWSNHFGLVSMREIYENAKAEQAKYLDNLIALYKSYSADDPRRKVKPTIEQQPLAQQYSHLFKFDTNGLIQGLKEFHFDIAGMLNKDGIVMVGGNIFQYNADNIKIIEGGDKTKIASLNYVTETSKKMNIIVNPVKTKLAKSPSARYGTDQHWCSGSDSESTYYTNCSISISLYQVITYGDEICDCSGSLPDEISPVCNCYYPIIGVSNYTLYTTHMDITQVWAYSLGITVCVQPDLGSTISAQWWEDNGVSHVKTGSSVGYSNTNLTVYDGLEIGIASCHHVYTWADSGIFTVGSTGYGGTNYCYENF
jgi:hypothetical protein